MRVGEQVVKGKMSKRRMNEDIDIMRIPLTLRARNCTNNSLSCVKVFSHDAP